VPAKESKGTSVEVTDHSDLFLNVLVKIIFKIPCTPCLSITERTSSTNSRYSHNFYQCITVLSHCSYDVFITRILLAALDHNVHLFRTDLEDSNGQVQYKKTFSKRSKNWRVEPVKERKKYPHRAVMAAKILEKRASYTETIVRHKTVQPNHPKRLAATIAMKEAPSTAELVQARLSRFS